MDPIRSSSDQSDSTESRSTHSMKKREFGRRLSKMLLEKGWNQSELARRANIQRDSVSVYIRGRSFPTPLNLQKMAAALGVGPEDILPNHIESAIAEDEPSFELKVSQTDPSRARVRVNQTMSLETAVKIADLLQLDQQASKK